MPTMVTAVDGNVADPSTGNAKSNLPFKLFMAVISQSEGVPNYNSLMPDNVTYGPSINTIGEIAMVQGGVGSIFLVGPDQCFQKEKTYIWYSASIYQGKKIIAYPTSYGDFSNNAIEIDTMTDEWVAEDDILLNYPIKIEIAPF